MSTRATEGFFLGDVKVQPPVVLAPMAGYTGPVFRLLCRGMGAGLVYTEMLSSEALTREEDYRRAQLRLMRGEGPTVVQLFGADPGRLAESARMAEAIGAVAVDLNLGCPAPRVLRSGAGAALAARPDLARRCLAARAAPAPERRTLG
ncbi:MAG: tRNA-dihydrouridine synthase family protein, partial [Armatimonadetes bacterium]|nr:tRNA-dihydrouridine synthase family protein [Armatimonadota bacterium]